jgi:hypothetical protein
MQPSARERPGCVELFQWGFLFARASLKGVVFSGAVLFLTVTSTYEQGIVRELTHHPEQGYLFPALSTSSA